MTSGAGMAIRISKEEREERGENQQWHGAYAADGQSRRERESGRATDEGIARPINQ